MQIFITVCVCSQFENLAFVYTAVVLCGSEAVRIEWIYFGARWCARHPDLAIAFLVFCAIVVGLLVGGVAQW